MLPIDAMLLLRLVYIGSAVLVLFVASVPPLRARFLDYGARTAENKVSKSAEKSKENGTFVSLLDWIASIRVPHSWFTSFYAVSVLSSLYWAPDVLSKGPAFQAVSQHVLRKDNSMRFEQVVVTWLLMFAQGSRRLYECIVFSAPSKSKMWFGHWALGIMFYVASGIAVWIEGASMLQAHKVSINDFALTGPNLRTIIGVLVFILASGIQHDCHAYLASLKKTSPDETKSKYKLPDHPAFNISLTPHYFAECLIYTSLSILAAPEGDWLNWTFVAALVFVAVNLGVTADGTRKWYREKFGADAVAGRARMIPSVY